MLGQRSHQNEPKHDVKISVQQAIADKRNNSTSTKRVAKIPKYYR